MKGLIIPLLILLFQISLFAQYENQSYLPLTSREMNNTFPVRYIGTFGDSRPGYFKDGQDFALPEKVSAGVSEIFVLLDENEENLIISGKDKNSKDWNVKVGFCYFCATRFYVSDLDKNGIKDLILLIPTGGNGLAPTSHFMSLTFDRSGRPVPFRADGYFEDRKGKIFDLVDINKDGRAELLYMNFDDGYWITNFYKVRNARWQKVKGKLGTRSYPLFTRFTNKENYKPTFPKKGRNPFAPDLSNNSSIFKGKISSYDWAKIQQSEDITLHLINQSGKKYSASPVSWYSSFFVVLETRNERRIFSLSVLGDELKKAFDEIIRKKYLVELYGNRKTIYLERKKDKDFRPELLWAVEQ